MVALSTIATVIASQALISGVFSLTQQAIQLGFCPRVHIVHTSAEVKGQIYIPGVNYALMIACLLLVLSFRESSRLAGAYGMAVTATMSLTSLLYPGGGASSLALAAVEGPAPGPAFSAVRPQLLRRQPPEALRRRLDHAGGGLRHHDRVHLLAQRAARKSASKLFAGLLPLDVFLSDLERQPLARVRGTAVFMTLSPEGTPPTLLHHVKHNHMLHEHVVLLTIQSADAPVVANEDRLRIERLSQGFYRLVAW